MAEVPTHEKYIWLKLVKTDNRNKMAEVPTHDKPEEMNTYWCKIEFIVRINEIETNEWPL